MGPKPLKEGVIFNLLYPRLVLILGTVKHYPLKVLSSN